MGGVKKRGKQKITAAAAVTNKYYNEACVYSLRKAKNRNAENEREKYNTLLLELLGEWSEAK